MICICEDIYRMILKIYRHTLDIKGLVPDHCDKASQINFLVSLYIKVVFTLHHSLLLCNSTGSKKMYKSYFKNTFLLKKKKKKSGPLTKLSASHNHGPQITSANVVIMKKSKYGQNYQNVTGRDMKGWALLDQRCRGLARGSGAADLAFVKHAASGGAVKQSAAKRGSLLLNHGPPLKIRMD